MAENPFRVLPSVSDLSKELLVGGAVSGETLTAFLQMFLDEQRIAIQSGDRPRRDEILARAQRELESLAMPRLSPVINATGVILHTNLGRAPVSARTAEAMRDAAMDYVSLELDPATNLRGGRMNEISRLMRLLTGAEATLVVNNNAAAITLVLSALATGKGAIVSRGEAVEIGGGFRIPDVMRQSGARLVEVGTTNRTYPSDYENAVEPDTALFLKVHASNFRIDGFTATTSIADLSPVSERTGIPIVEDLGSGSLLDTAKFGLAKEPTIGESIVAGAAVITASGDKLLGGPQAGIIAGRAGLIARIEQHPLVRAFRVDKTCLAGIAATLRHYAKDEATEQIPVWRMISTTVESLMERAETLRERLAVDGVEIDIVESRSTVGGGSLPGEQQPSIALEVKSESFSPDELAMALRTGNPGVFGRIEDNRVLLDLRAVLPGQDDQLRWALLSALSRGDSR